MDTPDEDIVVESLKQDDADALLRQREAIQQFSRLAAQAGMELAEKIAASVLYVNKGNAAQQEYIRLIGRRAKKSNRHYCGQCEKDEVADLDLNAKTITFKKVKSA